MQLKAHTHRENHGNAAVSGNGMCKRIGNQLAVHFIVQTSKGCWRCQNSEKTQHIIKMSTVFGELEKLDLCPFETD